MTLPAAVRLTPLPPVAEAALLRLVRRIDPMSTEARTCRIAITTAPAGCSGETLRAFPNLDLLASLGAGHEKIDLIAAARAGVSVTVTPDALTACVADLALGLSIAIVRGIVANDAYVRSGAWAKSPRELARRFGTLRAGIVGLGRIGRAVAERLQSLGLEVGYWSRSRKPVAFRHHDTLRDLAAHSDLLIVTAAADPSGRALLDAAVLAALRPDAYLVNVARASVVDESALIGSLQAGRLAGAALDVMNDEPTPSAALLACPNLIVQPHVGSATYGARQGMAEELAANIAAFLDERPLPGLIGLPRER
jgi:hydroxypyruvate reductase